MAEKEFRFAVPPAQEDLGYDEVGNLTSDGLWKLDWDHAGRLIKMTRRPQAVSELGLKSDILHFVYDADGRRTRKIRTRTYDDERQVVEESRVLWSGWLPVLEERFRDGLSLGRRFFVWGADVSGSFEGAGGIGGLLTIREEDLTGEVVRTLLPVQDGLGNITAILNAENGSVVAQYDMGPFGDPLGECGEVDACPFRFQSKCWDAETELSYFGYRYYSPRLGRWLSRDPLGEAGGINLYAYCGNDPVNRHDPTAVGVEDD